MRKNQRGLQKYFEYKDNKNSCAIPELRLKTTYSPAVPMSKNSFNKIFTNPGGGGAERG
jgi:hypothetical protein